MESYWGANSSNCLSGPSAAQDTEIFGVYSSYWQMNHLRMVWGCVTVPFHWGRIQWILKTADHTQDTASSCLSRAAQQPHSLSPGPHGLPNTHKASANSLAGRSRTAPSPLAASPLQNCRSWCQPEGRSTHFCSQVIVHERSTGGLIKPLCPITYKWSTLCSHRFVVVSKPPPALPPKPVHGLAGGDSAHHPIDRRGKMWQTSRVIRQRFTCQNSRFNSSLELVRMLWLKRNKGWQYDGIYCNGICSIFSRQKLLVTINDLKKNQYSYENLCASTK